MHTGMHEAHVYTTTWFTSREVGPLAMYIKVYIYILSGCRKCSERFFRFLLFRCNSVFFSVFYPFSSPLFFRFLLPLFSRFLPWRGGPFRTPSLLQEDKAQEARFPKSHDHIMAVQKPFQIASFRQFLELDVPGQDSGPRDMPLWQAQTQTVFFPFSRPFFFSRPTVVFSVF
jgi:hypothetical protein